MINRACFVTYFTWSHITNQIWRSCYGYLFFWWTVSHEYPLFSASAMKVLLSFSTTYLCQVSFSALTATKTKYRSRMNVEDDLRVCLSKIPPRIDMLCKSKQHHLDNFAKVQNENEINKIIILSLPLYLLLYLWGKHWKTKHVNKKYLSLIA